MLFVGIEAQHPLRPEIIHFIEKDLPRTINFKLEKEINKLESLENLCQFLSPEATLKRGFSLTLKDGKVVSNSKELKSGDIIQTKFATGEMESKIEKIKK